MVTVKEGPIFIETFFLAYGQRVITRFLLIKQRMNTKMEFQIKELPLEEVESKVVDGLLDHKSRLSYGELHVSLLSVDKDLQGSGVGTALMNEIEHKERHTNVIIFH